MSDYTALREEVLKRFEGYDFEPDGPPRFAWHVHHGTLIELLTVSVVERVDYIIREKAREESPASIALRLNRLGPVRGALPTELVVAWKAYDDARKAYADAWKAYTDAWGAYAVYARKTYYDAREAYDAAGTACDDAVAQHMPAIEALHAAECPDCPWSGNTLFRQAEA